MSESSTELEVRNKVGSAPWNVLFCASCNPTLLPNVANILPHNEYSWCLSISCWQCKCQWFICSQCTSMKKPLKKTVRQLYLHDYTKHRKSNIKPAKKQRISLLDDNGEQITGPPFDFDSSTELVEQSVLECKGLPGPPLFEHFDQVYNKSYFNLQHNGGLGAASLVSLSNFHTETAASDINRDEVALHLNISGLLCSLTRGQREQFAVILQQTATTAVRHSLASSPWNTRLPSSMRDIRNFYVRGKNAIIPNLPRPPVSLVADHGYVCLKDCVADLLGHGLDVDSIDNATVPDVVRKSSETAAAKRILDNVVNTPYNSDNVLCLYITEWSDGFEPSSCTKNNRGSCWIKTVTIAPPPSQLHKLSHTYPIAIGLDGDSHDKVEEKFAAELKEFSTGTKVTFYHGGIKKDIIVYLELFASLQDQPERRKANYIMLGGSKYTPRWGYSLDFPVVSKFVPACNACISSLKRQQIHETNACQQCVCWDVSKPSIVVNFPPPKDYPIEHIPSGNLLSPIKLSYAVMKYAVFTAHNEFVTGSWNKKNVDSFLRVHGLNNEAIFSIMECATNCRLLAEFENNQEMNGDPEIQLSYQQLLVKKLAAPEKFMVWKYPALWNRGVQLSQHVDVVMHLIFLGVVKTVIQMVQDWSKKRGKNAAFIRYLQGTLEGIQVYGLDWCRCIPYKAGKLGGWVSENYVAVARLLPWLYSCIDDVAPDVTFVEPTKEQRKWNMRENFAWLSIRGLDTNGNAEQLRSRVKNYIDQPLGPPSILPPPGGGVGNIIEMIGSLKAMVARIMKQCVSTEDIDDIECHIKLFLSSFESFDIAMRNTDTKPTWLTSYNFMCLINVPKMIQEFGPVRNLWEGGGQGEKIIGLLKPLWFGFRKNWHVNLLSNLLKRMAIDRVQCAFKKIDEKSPCAPSCGQDIEDDMESVDELDINSLNQSQKMVHKYINLEEIRSRFENRKPMSVVCMRNGTFACILRNNTAVELHCEVVHETFCGCWYHKWSIPNEIVQHQYTINDIAHYCLLLPRMTPDGMPTMNNEAIFTLVDSEWMDIQQDKTLKLPKAPNT